MAFKRDDLRERVLDIAEQKIAEAGAEELRARTVALEAEVSVGTIYNLFGSMNGLMEALFSRILKRFHGIAENTLGAVSDTDRRTALLALADVYLDFIEGNEAVWQSLLSFNRERPDVDDDPYVAEQGPLFDLVGNILIDTPLDSGGTSRRQAARMLWSSVHGIVSMNYLGMANSARARETRAQIELLVDLVLNGMRAKGEAK